MNYNSFILFLPCLLSFCLCEITEEKKSKLLSDFINYYNFRPNVDHKASDGFLQSISEIDDTTYQIEVSFSAKHDDVSKMMKCSAGIQDLDDRGIAIVNNVIDCEELEQQAAREADASLEAVEDQAERRPVWLETEEQVDTGITSGEQFITITRTSHVHLQAQGIQDLAHLGVRHLDIHDPSVKHSLDSVIDVERQVQVVDGVKYILTLSIHFNSCTGIINDFCTSTKTCRISILAKPWQTLLSGAKYRAVVSNNCTEEWKFGDNGEVLPESTDNNNHSKKEERTSSNIDKINIERHVDVQSLPNEEKTQQMLPYDYVPVSSSWKSDTLWPSIKETSKDHVLKTESNQRFRLNSLPETQFIKPKTFSLSPNKEKAIDEMLDFLNVSGYKPQVQSQAEDSVKRSKRSYDYDLQVLALTQDYRDLKKSIENAKYVYEMAQAMVNYLNAMDIEVKNRAVKNVIKAEEEEDDDKHFVYIQAQIVIPCDTPNCEPKETQTKICNGVLDNTNKKRPQVLYSFCYTDSKEMNILDQFKDVESDDPVLLRLSKEALKKIEFDSKEPHAMKIKKIASANTRLASGRLTKISMIVDYINCNKSVPLVLRKKCSSLEYLGSRICEILVHERQWLKERTITYTCTERPMDQIITKDKQHKNLTTDDPKIAEILQDALQYLEIQSSKKNKQKIIKVSNISTQIVAGFLITIEFVVGYTNCTDTDIKSQSSKCELLRNERLRRCKAQVWDRSWIVDGRQMEVLCDEDPKKRDIFPKTRGKRDVAFRDVKYKDTNDPIYKSVGERSRKKYLQDTSERIILGGEIEQNSTNPFYVQLAKESLQKYITDSGIQQSHLVVRIDKVTTQVVSGSLTRINFTAAPNTNSGGNVLECFSKIWEQSWLNKKEIDVSCVPAKHRFKRQLVGGEEEQNPNEPVYVQLAQESLQKYITDSGIQQPHSVLRIDKVTSQVVSGSITRINFVAAPNSNSGGHKLECFSKIWEQSWLNKKEIDVSCVTAKHRFQRQLAGGEEEQNPNEPVYVQLAQESLRKYIKDSGIQQSHLVVRIDKVTTQVVSGSMTRINFVAAPNTNSDGHKLECFSKIWEQSWLNKKEIDVSCVTANERFQRQLAGGEEEQNPNEPVYVQLAQESLRKYIKDSGIQQSHLVVRIDKVTTQVVSGSLTRINFTAAPNTNSGGNVLECFSKIWEQSWLNKKEIDVSCVPANNRFQRQLAGGEKERNPNEPVYVQLAQESLQKYITDSGIQQPHSVLRIDKVTTQVVSGSMTRINFVAAPNTNHDGHKLECFSKIWEQSGLNKKEIDVSCVTAKHRFKRQLVGGEEEQNPNEPVYVQLAQESLQKYITDSGIQQPHSVLRIDKVTTQVVSGSMTRINFVAAPNNNPGGNLLNCFSKIWEQSWLNKKEIDVSCVNANNRFQRHLLGGEEERNPNEPVYVQLAQESLQKYITDSGIQQPYSVLRIDKVTTQVVSGSMTRINFLTAPNTDSYGRKLECFSKIWEQSWLNKKEIDVSCVTAKHRFKRQLVGGEEEQNPNEPVYVQLAQESLQKYITDSGIQQPHSVLRIDKVTTQVVSGSMTRINFVAASNTNSDGHKLECFSKIWEQSWLNKREIDVSCVTAKHRFQRQLAGGEEERNPNEPVYVQLAQESLQKYITDSGIQQPHSVFRIDKVTTQVVSGSMTRINFVAAPNTNSDGHKLECFSKIWEQSWLNKKEIDVSCVTAKHRFKRQLVGGEEEQNPNEPVYVQLAQESLQKYITDSGIQQPHSVLRIDKVTTQVVSGSMTRINFVAASNTNSDGHKLECFSKIWEQSWLNKREIDVSCVTAKHRFQRQLAGGEEERNPNEPVYVQLAQESLQKYITDSGIQQPHSVFRIDKVTTQVVSGSMTRINFVAAPNTNSDGHKLECFSKIWEQSWLNKKEIDVSCVTAQHTKHRFKRQLVGGEEEQNPNEPVYVQLAQESLQKYITDSGIQQPHSVFRIDKVTSQVVSGSITRINFVAAPNSNSGGHKLECFSKIWEQSWLNKKEIDVSCVTANNRFQRQLAGGEEEQNPNEPVYVQLAQESLQKYITGSGIQQPHSVLRIDKVTTQVVSGSMTRINFVAAPNSNSDGHKLECFSKIWEQSWLNKREIDVSCVTAKHRFQRQLAGGEKERNPNEPVYVQLAQESLQKYITDSGIQQPHSVFRIDKVTTQVVSGSMTRINFVAAPNTNSDGHKLECFSKIWEQSWLNKKEIDVSCVTAQHTKHRFKRQLVGGEEEQNPNEPVYVQLAQESLQKYITDSGIQQPHSVFRIDKVTSQVVSGSITRINFVAAPNINSDGRKLECFSKIWEQSWLNKKEIDVSCVTAKHRFQRQLAGGEEEQNPNEPVYVQLAQESLRKYIKDSGIQQSHLVVRIDKVTTQVVSGSMTRINFVAAPNTNSDGHKLECFSKIWEQSWLNKKEIDVSCVTANERFQRQLAGGEEEQNPNESVYVQLAQESLRKYIKDFGIQQSHLVVRIDKVTTQVVSGSLTRINFTAAPNTNSGGNVLECFSKIWEQSWLNKKEIDVSCVPANNRFQRQLAGGEKERNPNEPVYVQLAQDSLQKYITDSGIQQPHSVLRIDKVTTQVVSGSMTRINFVAAPNTNHDGHKLECFSKIWEQSGLNKKEIDVSCVTAKHRFKRQLVGGEEEQNPNEPVYVQLAQESLQKYITDSGIQQPHSVLRIDKVTTQVVSGSITRINFVAAPNNNPGGNLLNCFSKIWEQSWLNKKEIDVSCVNANNRFQRHLLGGEEERNPNEPVYVQLAQESLQKYITDSGIQQPYSVLRIDKVTTQVVSGSMTRINFLAAPNTDSYGRKLECFSKIWEQSWLNKKEIDVSCVTAKHRFKRQLVGGEEEQNPNEPVYVQLAQESLQKYITDSGIQQPHSVLRIDKVTTQVVSGSMTRINFVAASNTNSDGHKLECFSKIWEQSWLNKREIDVLCVTAKHRFQRQLAGGEEERNPNEPVYVQLAQESLQKYITDSGIQQPHSVFRIDKVTTQVVSGSMTRINFVAAPNTNSDGHKLECFSKIWEQSWLNKKEIDVSCVTAKHRFKRQLVGGEEEQNPNEPVYVQLAQESLQKYITDSGIQQPHSVLRIDKVTTQVVSGSMTRINFVAASNTNSDGHKLECFSKIWEQSWLNKREIDVSCVTAKHRFQRQLAGGEEERNPNEPVYVQLAQESLQKYITDSGIQQPHSVFRIDKVTTQVVSGSMTRINFVAAPNTNSDGHKLECFSKIWEQSWLNKKEIDVSCVTAQHTKHRFKRQLVGGEEEQNPNEPVYVQLAQESLQKYITDSGIQQPHSVFRIDKVTSQVVSGSITRINFVAAPNINSDGRKLECFSKIWEQSWLNKKEIDVSCVTANNRFQRQLAGGEEEQNPNKPVYVQLAQESLQKYITGSGIQQPHSVLRIDKVTTQVVSGSMTRINFVAAPNSNSDGHKLECFSKIWEQSWLNKREIDVSCVTAKHRFQRQIAGGEKERNPNEPVYVQLAQESLQKYITDSGIQQPHSVFRIDKVTTQVVSGSMTRINFVAAPNTDSYGRKLECFSKIWEQSWLNKKEIDVSCVTAQHTKHRFKRQLVGGEEEQNPNEPVYVQLAQESLQKYITDSGIQQPHSVLRIDKVTTQVVSGSMTRINFVAVSNTNSNGHKLECFSKIWEQSWLNKREIDVSCVTAKHMFKRQLVGVEVEQSPNEPVYVQLAQESLQKYITESGNKQPYSVLRIENVTTQLVSGSLTRIYFVAAQTNNPDGKIYKCFAKIWEQPWLNKKEIYVFCEIDSRRFKRDINGSGLIEQDPSDPKYFQLADKSLQKYLIETYNKEPLRVVNVQKVTTQVVSGILTRLNFIVISINVSNSDILKCYSEVWNRSLTENVDIDVSCQLLYKNAEDPKNATYLQWAKESLQKYLSDTQNNHSYKVVQIEEASWQSYAANIIFVANSTESLVGSLNCVSVILIMAEMSEKKINVICEPVDSELRKKWNRMDDPKYDKYTKYQYTKHNNIQEELAVTKPEFQLLASQSLRQYSKKVGILYKLFAVKMVTKNVMSDVVYKIYFTAFPTDCISNVSNMRALTCNVIKNSTVNCRTKIVGEPSLQARNIQAECVMPEDYLDLLDSTEENANEWPSKIEIPRKTQDSKAHTFAEEALQEYLSFTDTKYVYRITGIYSFYEHLADEKIEFSISPTICLTLKFTGTGSTDNCPFKQPKLIYYCNAKRNSNLKRKKDIKVTCKRIQMFANRSKRQINTELIDDTENEVDEDTMYYYAKAAVSKINENPQNNNMFKLVTIHAVKSSVQMKAVVVKMYLEVAETYCVRFQSGITIENCEEMEGLNHKLCLARIFPAPGDDLVIRHVNVVCDDDEVAFNVLTGIHVFELLRLSLQELERKPEFHFKLVHQGEPQLIPTLEAKKPLKLNFIIATTNCSKNVDLDKNPYQCYIDTTIPSRSCSSFIWLETATRIIKYINVDCNSEMPRQKRSSLNITSLTDSAEIKDLVSAALEKLEMASLHRYKQRVLHINSYSSKITTGKVTTIDFDVAYTSCLKYEWVQNITSCDIIDHLPRRHCVAQIWERLWIRNGRHINVTCEDDETPLEAHIEFESAEMAMQLAQEALKHIEAKYPHPQKQKIVRIFSLEKQIVAGIHYKMKVEVGFTHCLALSSQANCTLNNDGHMNRFCRVNVWVRPWTDHPPNFRVSCDFQESATSDLYHGVQAEYLFSNFVATYNPSYSDDHVEFERRFDIFRANIKKIHELNVHEKGTATYGLTRFADLTYKEFKARYMGLNISLRNNSQVSMKEADIPNVNLPANFDWREFDSVTEIKDQGSCGSGWAFSVIGNIEGQWRMQSGELVQLSEQQLLDCDNKDNGCGGGLPEHAYRAIEEMGGLETEINYPYEAEGSKCLFNRTMAKVKIQGAVNITSNETAMAQWLVQNGPISIGINAMAMQFYLGGISHPWTSYCNASNIDHAALIVGFGVKEYPAFHKKIPYWIVKNSWGKSWGEEGYYRVYRGDGTCGINRMATSAFIPSM